MVGTETLGGSADDAHYTILAVSCGGEPTTPQGGESSGTPYNPSATATSLQEAGWQVLDQEESLGTCASVTEVGVHVPRVLVFTAHTSVEDVAGATLAGADGYLHKGLWARSYCMPFGALTPADVSGSCPPCKVRTARGIPRPSPKTCSR